jgi:hypothetical protein
MLITITILKIQIVLIYSFYFGTDSFSRHLSSSYSVVCVLTLHNINCRLRITCSFLRWNSSYLIYFLLSFLLSSLFLLANFGSILVPVRGVRPRVKVRVEGSVDLFVHDRLHLFYEKFECIPGRVPKLRRSLYADGTCHSHWVACFLDVLGDCRQGILVPQDAAHATITLVNSIELHARMDQNLLDRLCIVHVLSTVFKEGECVDVEHKVPALPRFQKWAFCHPHHNLATQCPTISQTFITDDETIRGSECKGGNEPCQAMYKRSAYLWT